MGMPVTIEIVDPGAAETLFDTAFGYFEYIDAKFSTYKDDSEISRINRGEISLETASQDMQAIFMLAEQTRQQTNGFFDIARNGKYDPSGLVKGWAIFRVAELLRERGCQNLYVDAGGDVQVVGKNDQGQNWRVGIRNPFDMNEIVKILSVSDCGVATSGTYVRGQHIYNPKNDGQPITDVVSITVIGPDIYESDRFATAAFAMGKDGINFIHSLEGFEAYMIDNNRRATFTKGFERYVIHA